jgi:hypothetical protein
MKSLGKSLLLAILGSMVAASGAHADFRLRVEDLTFGTPIGVVVTDNGPGDFNPNTGLISFVGNTLFSFVDLTAFSKPLVGGATDLAQLFLDVQLIQAANPDIIRITLEDTDYTGGPNGPLFLNATLAGFLGGPGSATFQSWVNPANLVPALGPDSSPGVLPPIGGTPAGSVAACSPTVSLTNPPDFLLSKTCSATFSKGGPYSLFAQATLNLTQAELAGFSDRQEVQASPQAAPEPSSLLLTIAGLVALVLCPLVRRRS